MNTPKPKQLQPLKVTCTSTDCEHGLHCFRRKTRKAPLHGPCRECGVELVDWPRVHSRKLDDIGHTVQALQQERIRHHFWHVEIDPRAVNHARRKGASGVEAAVAKRLRTSIGGAEHPREGRQTPMKDNVIYYAQHATATCCRFCLEEWHGIPRGVDLRADEILYLSAIVMTYVRARLPNLSTQGEKVPPIRRVPTRRSNAA